MVNVWLFVLGIGAMLVSIPIRAYTVMTIWAWFIVPGFGLAPLTMLKAGGLALMVGMLTYQPVQSKDWDERSTAEKVGALIAPIMLQGLWLFFGWLVKVVLG